MFPSNVEFLGRERDRERLQEAEHNRLVKIARHQRYNYNVASRKIANWLGCQFVKWGAKLQTYSLTPLSNLASPEMAETGYVQAKSLCLHFSS